MVAQPFPRRDHRVDRRGLPEPGEGVSGVRRGGPSRRGDDPRRRRRAPDRAQSDRCRGAPSAPRHPLAVRLEPDERRGRVAALLRRRVAHRTRSGDRPDGVGGGATQPWHRSRGDGTRHSPRRQGRPAAWWERSTHRGAGRGGTRRRRPDLDGCRRTRRRLRRAGGARCHPRRRRSAARTCGRVRHRPTSHVRRLAVVTPGIRGARNSAVAFRRRRGRLRIEGRRGAQPGAGRPRRGRRHRFQRRDRAHLGRHRSGRHDARPRSGPRPAGTLPQHPVGDRPDTRARRPPCVQSRVPLHAVPLRTGMGRSRRAAPLAGPRRRPSTRRGSQSRCSTGAP